MTPTGKALIALTLSMSPIKAVAADDSYLSRFAIPWKGGGSANLNLHLPSFPVSCIFASTSELNGITLAGSCRLKFLFFLTDKINATLIYDNATDTYSGTYSVGGGPPAILSGKRTADALDLDVTWPTPVNGHLKAKIYIVNDGRGLFTLKTVDPLGLIGTSMTTSDLKFAPQTPGG